MRHVAFVLALLASLTGGVAAQTCAGSLALPISVWSGGRAVPISVAALFHVEALFVERVNNAAPEADLDALLARPEAEVPGYLVHTATLDLDGDLRPADTLAFRTRCGYAAVRLRLTRDNGGAPLVVDLLNVPPHLPYTLDAPLLVEPGHVRLDFDRLGEVERSRYPYRLIPVAAFERVESDARR